MKPHQVFISFLLRVWLSAISLTLSLSRPFHSDGYGYVPSALEQQHPRHSYPARNDNATAYSAEGHYGNEMSYGVNGTKSSLDMTVETTMTAPTMSYDLSTTELQPRSQNFTNNQ